MLHNFIVKIVTKLFRKIIEERMYLHTVVVYKFYNNILKFIPKRILDDVSDTDITYLILRFPCNMNYRHKVDYKIIYNIIEKRPTNAIFLKNPEEDLQFLCVRKDPFNILVLDNPTEDVIYENLSTYWLKDVYDEYIINNDISDELKRKINKLKLEKGPLNE